MTRKKKRNNSGGKRGFTTSTPFPTDGVAYIDGANLHKGINEMAKELDYAKLRKWLFWKYHIETAYLFLGYIKTNERLYAQLRSAGFALVFKEIRQQGNDTKANVDAELVLQAAKDAYERQPDATVLVSNDGDFACLVDFLRERGTLKALIAPNRRYCSYLLRKRNLPIVFMDDIIGKMRKGPR